MQLGILYNEISILLLEIWMSIFDNLLFIDNILPLDGAVVYNNKRIDERRVKTAEWDEKIG